MHFSVEIIYCLEKDIQVAFQKILKATKTSSTSEISTAVLLKLNKDIIAAHMKSIVDVLEKNLEMCKLAANKIDQLKTEQIENQKEILRTQQKEINSVQTVVKSELKSWADIARTSSNQNMNVSATRVKEAVKLAVAEEDRSRNFMMYGLEE